MDLLFLSRFGKALCNVKKVLVDRGYTIDRTVLEPLQIMGNLYKKSKSKKCSLSEAALETYSHPELRPLTVHVFDRNYDTTKCKDRMISTDQVKLMQDIISGNLQNDHIVLSPNKLSPQAKKETIQAEVFLFDDLLIDLPRHNLVLPHRVIDRKTAKEILGPTIRLEDLPILELADPIARWYKFAPGSVIFIDNPVMPCWRIVK